MKTTITLLMLLLALACAKNEIALELDQPEKPDTIMALPNVNLSMTAIRNELGESSNDLYSLYFSPKINQWAAFKPYNSASDTPASGLKRQSTAPFKCYWDKPLPSNGANMGHFRYYNHQALPPTVFDITDVQLVHGASIWNNGSPILLKDGFYRFYFRFFRGDCNPQAISGDTGWTKQTNGSGGICCLERSTDNCQTDGGDVYSVLTTPTTQDKVLQITSYDFPFYVYYVTNNGSEYYKTKLIETSYPLLPDNITVPWHNNLAILDNYAEWMTDEQDGDVVSSALYSQLRWIDPDDFVTTQWTCQIWAFNVTTQQVIPPANLQYYYKWKVEGVWDATWTSQALNANGEYQSYEWFEYHNNLLHKIEGFASGATYEVVIIFYDTTGLLNISKKYTFTL
jgi:hypothetical protein